MHARQLALSLAAAGLLPGSRPPLRVLRTTPDATASPSATISVAFDRPVAGSLDYTIDPHTIVHVEPDIPGTLEWRDPITIQLTPAHALTAGATYTVVVDPSFHAMDGSRLAEPYRFTFRTRGPTLIWGTPAAPDSEGRFVEASSSFELAWTAAPDLALLERSAQLTFDTRCAGRDAVVHLTVAGSPRPVNANDPWHYRVPDRDVPDSGRQVVTLTPNTRLPLGCRGELVVPYELTPNTASGTVTWVFRTYGSFKIDSARSDVTGPVMVRFSTPVRGSVVRRHVALFPSTPFTMSDTAIESAEWQLDARLNPRTAYAVMADTALRDVFGQRLTGNPAAGFRTPGFDPEVDYAFGRLLVERTGYRTFAIQHMNVDTLIAYVAPVSDTSRSQLLVASPWSLTGLWHRVSSHASIRRIAVKNIRDKGFVTLLHLPEGDTTLVAIKVVGVSNGGRRRTPLSEAPVALLEISDLGVHAKIGADRGAVWVTSAEDGSPRAGALVTLHSVTGSVVATATTDADGVARLTGYAPVEHPNDEEESGEGPNAFTGFVDVRLGNDHTVLGIGGYEPDLSPWQFNVQPAQGASALPGAVAVFTDRGIYRPGESVYAKAIVRRGVLGALHLPSEGDSLRWELRDREFAVVKDTIVRLSAFGTAAMTFAIPRSAGLGECSVRAKIREFGSWRSLGAAGVRIAEYRPPEFLVDVSTDSAPSFAGDSMRLIAQARYLFGAPMARAAIQWQAEQSDLSPWDVQIPGTDGWEIGDGRWWGDDGQFLERGENESVFASGTDTLDATGRLAWRVELPHPAKGRGARVRVQATVVDVNRQNVVTSVSTIVHPAAFYLAAKVHGSAYFWTAGTPVSIDVMAVRPAGDRVSGVAVRGIVTRHEWHQVQRVRGGMSETVGDWVIDTVGKCDVTTRSDPVSCSVTPKNGGEYAVTLTADDANGRPVLTSVARWVTGPGWVPWDDESRFKMDVVADRASYKVGDTATVLIASPLTNVSAWVTVEREGIIEQHRIVIKNGSSTLRIPITEAFVPNAFVSVFETRGRSAAPGKLDDPGRPTIRVGYASIRVLPAVKTLAVSLTPDKTEYRPSDSTHVSIQVRGPKSEVTLWAVDEGVLSLTGYKTPDPVALLYAERGLGVRLSSNLSSVAPQIPEGQKGRRSPGGGGGADGADVLRSRFQTTAFFLSSVVTDSMGHAVAVAKLPDNLTTFRVMAVAVTAGDRYGSSQTPLLVTKPLLIRPALPRFVRAGDTFTAGGVVNKRNGATASVRVSAEVRGAQLHGASEQTVTLAPGRGVEARFPFAIPNQPPDSVTFTLGVRDADHVRLSIPTRPDYTPRAHTIAGALRDTATIQLALPAGTDPARSTVTVSAGASVFAMIKGAAQSLHVYPYLCSEQVTSEGLPLLALLRGAPGMIDTADVRRQLRLAVELLSNRQRADGGIGLWDANDWTSPYLSAYAGELLVGARVAGLAVDDSVLARLGRYMHRVASTGKAPISPVTDIYREAGATLSERVSAVAFLRRVGRPDLAAEDELVRQAAQLWPIDRAGLAVVIAARPDGASIARALMEPEWAMAHVEGRRAVFPDSSHHAWYFPRTTWMTAEVLLGTLAVDPRHPLIGPLVETLVQQARAGEYEWLWTTHDLAALITALSAYDAAERVAIARGMTIRARGRVIDTVSSLARLLDHGKLEMSLTANGGASDVPVYYYITVNEIPLRRNVTPDEQGIAVERWYEKYDGKTPVVGVAEGDLVRVHLTITVPVNRQFVVLDDPLPAGLEAVDLSLLTTGLPGPGAKEWDQSTEYWSYGSWDGGWWSPFDHHELRDDRVVYFATQLWPGKYSVSYVARATTPGVFIRPPATATEMYNPAVQGRSDGGVFTVTPK